MSTVRELIAATFSGEAYPLAPWYAALLEASPPLRGFSATNAPKIRKKVRQARTPDEQRDLRCELAVAAALMDRRSPLSYEPLVATGRRGPDFLLRYKGHTTVYVEVSRMRPPRSEEPEHAGRVAALLCGKLGQLVAGAANLLVIVSDAGPHPNEEIGAIIQGLRRRAASHDDAFFAFRGLAGARTFTQLLPRLSAVLLVTPAEPAEQLWPLPQARHALPDGLARAIAGWALAATIGPLS